MQNLSPHLHNPLISLAYTKQKHLSADYADIHGAASPQSSCFAWRFLGVLRDLAVKLYVSIHRQDAKIAKKSAKRKFFPGGQENFPVSSAEARSFICVNLRNL